MDLITIKNLTEIAENAITSAALIAAGVWTYFHFIRNRLRYPKVELRHKIFKKEFPQGKVLVNVNLTVANTGDVLLPVLNLWSTIYQIDPPFGEILTSFTSGDDPPLDGAEIDWPAIQTREIKFGHKQAEIEPGEKERFEFDFVFDQGPKVIKIYSYVSNERKKRKWFYREGTKGWPLTTFFDLT